MTLGSILRALRKRRGWTLAQMSAQSGIPVSTLSKVERDRLSLTYDKLQELSRRLQIPMADLFTPEAGSPLPAVTARRSVGRLEHAVELQTPNYSYAYLCTELRKKRMIPILTRVRARSLDEFGPLVVHDGEEFLYVLEGSIEVHTEFYDPVTLAPGESIYLDSSMGHAYLVAPGTREATAIAVCAGGDDYLRSLLAKRNKARASRNPERSAGRRKRSP